MQCAKRSPFSFAHSSAGSTGSGVLSGIVGVVLLLVAALGVVVQLKDALNVIWETKEPASAGVWWYLRTYLISLAGILGLGFLLAVSLVVSTLLSAFSSWLGGGESLFWQAVNFLVSVGVLATLFSMLFKWFPDADVRWKAALKGGAARFSSTSASSPLAGTSARKDWSPPTERQPP
jgi:membrane protein